jgi:hypothetical protein
MSEAGPAKPRDESDDGALYRAITRHSGTASQAITPDKYRADKSHERGESITEETSAEDSEIIDITEFERKISALTVLDRDAALRLASDLIIRLHRRTCPVRFREQTGDRTRVAYARVLVSALQSYGVLLRDDEIEQLKQRIDALERVKGDGKS